MRKILVLVRADINGSPHLLTRQSPEWDAIPMLPSLSHDGSVDAVSVRTEFARRLDIPESSIEADAGDAQLLWVEKLSKSSGIEKTYEYFLLPLRIRRIPYWLREIGEPDPGKPPMAKDGVYYSWWPLNELKGHPTVMELNGAEIDAISKRFGSNLLDGLSISGFDISPVLVDQQYSGRAERLVDDVARFLEGSALKELEAENQQLRDEVAGLNSALDELREQLREVESRSKHALIVSSAWEIVGRLAAVATLIGFIAGGALPDIDIDVNVVHNELTEVTQSADDFVVFCTQNEMGLRDPSLGQELDPPKD